MCMLHKPVWHQSYTSLTNVVVCCCVGVRGCRLPTRRAATTEPPLQLPQPHRRTATPPSCLTVHGTSSSRTVCLGNGHAHSTLSRSAITANANNMCKYQLIKRIVPLSFVNKHLSSLIWNKKIILTEYILFIRRPNFRHSYSENVFFLILCVIWYTINWLLHNSPRNISTRISNHGMEPFLIIYKK